MMNQFYNTYRPYFIKTLQLSYPIVIGQLGIVLMGVADIVMIGKLDAVNLAAASLANSVFFLIAILGIGTLTAVSPLVAKSKAEGHNNECAILFRQGMWSALILSVFIGIVLFVLAENLEWFGQTERVTLLTKNYLHILNAGVLPMLIFMAVKQFSDGLGITKPSAVITMIALLLNVFLNWVLIYGKFGMPELGLFGAGVATSFSRLVMAVMMYLYVRFNQMYQHFHHLKQHDHDIIWLKKIFQIGLPSGFQYFFEVGAFAFAAIMIGWIGEYELAAHQVAINIASVTYMIATGLSAGGSIAVGDALGRRNRQDIIRSGYAAVILATAFMGVCAIVFSLFNQWIVALYINDLHVAEMATGLLIIAAFFQLSDGIQCVGLGILRGIGDTKIPTVITIIAYWVIGIPIGYYLGFKTGLSLYGIWISLSIGLSFSAVLLSFRFKKRSRLIDLNYHSAINEH
jgi:MATE family multidrug resistance protein